MRASLAALLLVACSGGNRIDFFPVGVVAVQFEGNGASGRFEVPGVDPTALEPALELDYLQTDRWTEWTTLHHQAPGAVLTTTWRGGEPVDQTVEFVWAWADTGLDGAGFRCGGMRSWVGFDVLWGGAERGPYLDIGGLATGGFGLNTLETRFGPSGGGGVDAPTLTDGQVVFTPDWSDGSDCEVLNEPITFTFTWSFAEDEVLTKRLGPATPVW